MPGEYVALHTIAPVGLADRIAQIEQALRSKRGHLFYIEAKNGMGKTFLARTILQRYSGVSCEIDFYFRQHHTPYGVASSVVSALGNCYFPACDSERDSPKSFARLFLQDWKQLDSSRRVLVVLDSLEKIRKRGSVDFLFWLLKWLSETRNAVFLLCSRPFPLLRQLVTVLGKRLPVSVLGLPYFSQNDTYNYISAVQALATANGDYTMAGWIEAISEELRLKTHLLARGHPVMTSLFLDYLLVVPHLPPVFSQPLSVFREDIDSIRAEVEGEVVSQFKNHLRRWDSLIETLTCVSEHDSYSLDVLARVSALSDEEAKTAREFFSQNGLTIIKTHKLPSGFLCLSPSKKLRSMFVQHVPSHVFQATNTALCKASARESII